MLSAKSIINFQFTTENRHNGYQIFLESCIRGGALYKSTYYPMGIEISRIYLPGLGFYTQKPGHFPSKRPKNLPAMTLGVSDIEKRQRIAVLETDMCLLWYNAGIIKFALLMRLVWCSTGKHKPLELLRTVITPDSGISSSFGCREVWNSLNFYLPKFGN